ncbi:MAG: phage holin family protein [Candidatus Thermoplasmatota archaeon]
MAALDSPEIQAVGEKLGEAGTAVAGVASRATHAVTDAAHEVQSGVRHVKEGVKVRADAVKETSRRAKGAPRRIGHEMTEAAKAWWHGLMVALSMSVAIGVFGIVTLVVVTIALVVSLNRLVGDPGGTWITALIYVVFGGIAYATMRSRKAAAQAKTHKHIENSKMEARHVVAPVKSAFGGRGRAGF